MSVNTDKPCVLLAEDEMFVAMMLEDRLTGAGYRVIKAARLAAALTMAENEAIDVAVLDINLDGEDSYPAAEVLRARGIPFLFSSGYGRDGLDAAHRDDPVLQKPYDSKALLGALEACRNAA